MEVFKKHGTKDRLFEMMNSVNKINLSESFEEQQTKNNNSLGTIENSKFKHLYTDNWGRDVYKKYSNGIKYIDVDGELYTITDSGEPESPTGTPTRIINNKQNDEITEDINSDQTTTPNLDNYKDQLEGGLGDNKTPKEFDVEQLKRGLGVEMEHTNDPMIALEIAIDHLMENSAYYGTENTDPNTSAMEMAKSEVNEDFTDDDSFNVKKKVETDFSKFRIRDNKLPKSIRGYEYNYELIDDSLVFDTVSDNPGSPEILFNVKYLVKELNQIINIPLAIILEADYRIDGYEFNTRTILNYKEISIINSEK